MADEIIHPAVLKYEDGMPKCCRSDYGGRKVWHYLSQESVGPRRENKTLCGWWISGSVVANVYAPATDATQHMFGKLAGKPLPICGNCRKRAKNSK